MQLPPSLRDLLQPLLVVQVVALQTTVFENKTLT
jgi:hypothetical protein